MFHLATALPLHSMFVAVGLLIYIVATRVRQERRHPYAALSWVLTIATFPYLGVPLFLIFGARKTVRPQTRREPVPAGPWATLTPGWTTHLLASLGVAEAQPQAAIEFQADGEQSLSALLQLIAAAQHSLDICTYVLGDDSAGQTITDAVLQRAQAGVQVRLLVDSIGSLRSGRSHEAPLKAAGVQIRRFMPALRNRRRGRTNLRNHRKLVVADGTRLWAGGRNLADEYFTHDGEQPAWIDLSFVVHGRIAIQAMALFDGDWHIAQGLHHALKIGYAQRAKQLASEWSRREHNGGQIPIANIAGAEHLDGATSLTDVVSLAHWVPSGPDFHEDILHALLVSAAFHAKQHVLLATPYFVPDEALTEALLLAAKRGVRVALLLPRRSNHRLADLARGRAMRTLIDNGVTVHMTKQMMHAKAFVIDDVLALCGSANLDSRSLFINYEAMAAFYGRREIFWLTRWFERTAHDAELATSRRPNLMRDVLEGVVAAVAFQL